MGLDLVNKNGEFSCRWSYRDFNVFREKLANSIGINLYDMKGYRDEHFNPNGKEISWKTIKNPIKYFLDHSDCAGTISAKRCENISSALKDILPGFNKNDSDYTEGLELIKLLDDCFNSNIPLLFH